MATFSTFLYVITDDEEHEIPVRVDYDAVYQRAKLYGPPEDCYPEESELTINSIEPFADLPEGITQKDLEEIAADSESLEEECWAHYLKDGLK